MYSDYPFSLPEKTLKELWDTNKKYQHLHSSVSCPKGVVVCTSNGIAAHIGSEMLRKGGTAADAVIATALAQIVLAAGSYVSFAGIYSMVYYSARESEVFSLGAEYGIPKNETDPMSIPKMGSGVASGRTALVPGFFAGIDEAHSRFGTLPRQTLFGPAIRLAKEGFEFTSFLEGAVQNRAAILGRLDDTKKIFTDKSGDFYKSGNWFTQPELAHTLRCVAEQGSDYIYQGPWASKFVDAVQREGGKITLDDLREYRVAVDKPVSTTYRDFSLFGSPFPNYGGLITLLTLNLLEAGDVGSLGQYTTSPKAMYWLIQAGKAAEEIISGLVYGTLRSREDIGLDIDMDNVLNKDIAKAFGNR